MHHLTLVFGVTGPRKTSHGGVARLPVTTSVRSHFYGSNLKHGGRVTALPGSFASSRINGYIYVGTELITMNSRTGYRVTSVASSRPCPRTIRSPHATAAHCAVAYSCSHCFGESGPDHGIVVIGVYRNSYVCMYP